MNTQNAPKIEYNGNTYLLEDLPEPLQQGYINLAVIEEKIRKNNSQIEELTQEAQLLALAQKGASSIINEEFIKFIGDGEE